jgi:hypothetical protein
MGATGTRRGRKGADLPHRQPARTTNYERKPDSVVVASSREYQLYELDAALEDEAEKLYVSAAAFLSHHQSVANYLTVELTILKEMSQALADLFGLRLPAPCKKQAHSQRPDSNDSIKYKAVSVMSARR